ncbi:response regulator [Sinorhizobium meliloti]|uniref:response regulator n=1 Tax=Rhizobium meliloti TaxID=382 RepID=UPI0001E4CDBA|nr:response regulator [Sinorhizobium meliloti]MDE4586356.1 response regulator [Sinorhizobium meliloti]SEJ45266.1 hypothetical protein SAMN04244575_04516 [Sinorhizobium meliloti]
MKPATILLADDEALLLLDYDSEIAGVVTDIRFFGLPDGWSVARVAREIDPDMPVVYVTGHGALEWPSRGVANSILLEKPFALAQLVTAVSQLLNAPRAPQCGA